MIIGISGGTGSGKTTVANRILETVSADEVVFIQQDLYYRNLKDMPLDYRNAANFDHPDALDNDLLINHLKKLRAGEPVEFGDDEGVAFADGGEGLIEARAGAVGAGEPVVKVDALLRDAELAEPVALGGEVLVVGGAAGVADQGLGHDPECTFSPGLPGFSPYGVTAATQVQAMLS